jgi:hypothetical protein
MKNRSSDGNAVEAFLVYANKEKGFQEVTP